MKRALAFGLVLAGVLAVTPALGQQYRFPLLKPGSGTQPYITAYRDHAASGLKDWNCGTKTYDGHKGTDIGIGGFAVMDAGSRQVVAAGDGTVAAAIDGCFDRCTSGACGCGGGFGNYVKITHADGKSTYYGHLMNGSVAVSAGQSVKCGQVLGKVGSSGNSTGPHLHFEPRYSNNVSDEPFSGPCGGSTSFWVSQGAYLGLPAEQCQCEPKPEVCNGGDDDCDGAVDEGDVCVLTELVLPQAGMLDGTTSSDLDGDGDADVCARAAAGIVCEKAGASGFSEALVGPELSDANGWGEPRFYGTLRMGDVDGDGKADVCARSSAGVHCWKSDGSGFPTQIEGPAWSDANGWGEPRFWSTLRLADVDGDGKADVCARHSARFGCHLSNGSGFGPELAGPELSDASGWGDAKYFGTIRMADVNGDGKTDVCARSSARFHCWLSDGAGFPTEIPGPELSDAQGWGDAKYWATLRMGDVNGDGKADVCARGAAGVQCWLSDGAGFPTAVAGPELSDAQGWGEARYWSTLRLTDWDGDRRADLCARAAAGFLCWPSNGAGFDAAVSGPDMADAGGWHEQRYFGSFRVADVTGDGKAEICGRGAAGVVCWPFDGTAFGATIDGPAWSSASGWDAPKYYVTLQAAGGCAPHPESCNGKDDDCDGEIDEGGVCSSQGSGGSVGSGGSGWQDGGVIGGAQGIAPEETPREAVDGGCACRSVPRAGSAPGGLFLLLGLALVRARHCRRGRGA